MQIGVHARLEQANLAIGRLQHGLANIPFRVIDIAIDDDARLLPEREQGIVAKGDLQAPLGPGAKLVLHMHRRPDDGGGAAVAARA